VTQHTFVYGDDDNQVIITISSTNPVTDEILARCDKSAFLAFLAMLVKAHDIKHTINKSELRDELADITELADHVTSDVLGLPPEMTEILQEMQN